MSIPSGRHRGSLRRAVTLVSSAVLGVQLALVANAVAAPPARGGVWTPPNTPRPTTNAVPRDPHAPGAGGAAAPGPMAQYQAPRF
ncbi:hypothetical protein, partial [Dactylosporangium sp. NPDC049140]|uniref:hypothetical protein n=1 Tax=Dactylosporangium sp. NPDC049140 TaxID=3155647 RepID=UPI0033E7D2F9